MPHGLCTRNTPRTGLPPCDRGRVTRPWLIRSTASLCCTLANRSLPLVCRCAPSSVRLRCTLWHPLALNSGHLSRHMKIHTGEMPHQCPVSKCDSRFSRKDNMVQVNTALPAAPSLSSPLIGR
ncbi:hypothetical protein BC831DRAFT_405647 [Entophlyctis helioformis]|nr:hypothetical protein BC831DRAFT_405647 [Entophlyctis helioformis]